MQKAHLYEAISLLNHDVDEALRGLERLKKAPGVAEGICQAAVATLEHARARVNLRFLAGIEQAEKRNAARKQKGFSQLPSAVCTARRWSSWNTEDDSKTRHAVACLSIFRAFGFGFTARD